MYDGGTGLDRNFNANPDFSDKLLPVRVWMMRTLHDPFGKTKALEKAGVPRNLIEKVLEGVGFGEKRTTLETHCYIVAHHVEADHYHTYVGHMHRITKDKVRSAYSNFIQEEDDRDDALRNAKLNELHLRFRPDWKGQREDPIFVEANSIDELMEELEKVGYKEDFLALFPNTVTNDSPFPITAVSNGEAKKGKGVPSTVLTVGNGPKGKLTKEGKIHASRRKLLVERFGEKNIAELEARIKNKGN